MRTFDARSTPAVARPLVNPLISRSCSGFALNSLSCAVCLLLIHPVKSDSYHLQFRPLES